MKHIIKCRLGHFPTANLRNVLIPDSPLKRRIKPGDILSFVSPECTVDCMTLRVPKGRTPCEGCFIYSNVANGILCFDQCDGRCTVIRADEVLEQL